jgi:hypothetical protein
MRLGAIDKVARTEPWCRPHGRLIPNITHMIPERGELLPRLENGEYDATIMPLHHFDAYRIDHPNTKLTASGYYLKIGFNMGFVGLAEKAVLIEQANPAIENMLKDGEASSLARLARMTYVPPRRPYILEHVVHTDCVARCRGWPRCTP